MIMIKNMSVYLSLLLILLCGGVSAHDITQILNQYPDYSTFNSYLTQTNLAASINARQTITVLVVNNAGLSSLSSTSSLDTIKNILSVHVILDYYDVAKLQHLTSSSALLTTLFQSTGLARGQQGFLKVTHPSVDTSALESAMPGSTQGSSIVGSAVIAEPYNISVIEISSPIIPQGIDGTKTSSPPTTTPTTTTAATTPPPPATVTAAPPTTITTTPPPPPPSADATAASPTTSTTTTPPPPPAVTAASPTSIIKAPVPSVAPPKPASSSPPTKAAAAPTTTDAAAPTTAATPSATPASGPTSGASVDDPVGATATEEPTETTPVGEKPKGKSAATTLETGLAVVCTMALSILYTRSIV